MNKILLVEDNDLIIKGLVFSLKQNNYNVDVAKSYHEALKLLDNIYDLVIIDITLPDKDGFDLGLRIKEKMKTPFIYLTAKDDEEDIIKGLNIAEDYVTKPFHTQELLTRIKKIMERTTKRNILKLRNIQVDLDKCLVLMDNKEVSLTKLEYKILVLLLTNINRVVSRELILEKIWDIEGNYVNDNTLTVYIKRIREKLHDDNLIKTIKGLGYRIDE